MRKTILLTLLSLAVACGGDPETETDTLDDGDGSSGGDTGGGQSDGVEIEGLLGTLSTMEINRGLEPRMPRFMRCFQNRYDDLEMLGGSIQFSFRIATDGSVRWVYPRASTVGDRHTERCLLDVAGGIRFPQPHGGEAEFNWPLAFDPPEDVRPPFNWDAERVADLIEEHGDEVVSGCGHSASFIVTAYVAPGGEVLAVGASSTDQEASGALDCVTDAIKAWGMPDPGSYPAKVTFELR